MVKNNLFSRVKYKVLDSIKPLTVHTETIYQDDVWGEVKKKALSGKVHTWYVMTPANYLYFKAYFNTPLSKKKISDIMKKRYIWLIKNGQRVQLHIHLSKLMRITKREQEELFRESLKWFEENLNFKPTEFVPGWWAYNDETEQILAKHKIKLIKEHDYKSTHDYNWVMN